MGTQLDATLKLFMDAERDKKPFKLSDVPVGGIGSKYAQRMALSRCSQRYGYVHAERDGLVYVWKTKAHEG